MTKRTTTPSYVELGVRSGAERVLDLGCGAGHTALTFAPRVAEVVAVDLAEAMLEQGRRLARERGIENVDFRLGDVERLDVPDGSFDVVTSRFSAHHYPAPERALAEVVRVLCPGGTFLLADSVAPEAHGCDSFLNTLEVLRDPSHVRDHRVSQWEAMFSEAGLTRVQGRALRSMLPWPHAVFLLHGGGELRRQIIEHFPGQ